MFAGCWLSWLTPNSLVALLGAAAGLVGGVTVWTLFGSRASPAARERKRRLSVNGKGRVGNATVIEVQGNIVCYEYTLAGVNYTASQDISDLRAQLPQDLSALVGPVTFKYLPRNPANSIVICEEWSGLWQNQQRAAG
jgi:hypothetical protein